MFGPGAFIFGVLLPLVVVGLVIYGVWELARSRDANLVDGVTGAGAPVSGTARSILDERFARGEVDTEEYVRRRALLDGTVPSPPVPVVPLATTTSSGPAAQHEPAAQYEPAAQHEPAAQYESVPHESGESAGSTGETDTREQAPTDA